MVNFSKKVQIFQKRVADLGFNFDIKQLANSTRTVTEAALVVGCNEGQIAKSLIFKTKDSQQPILVVASGTNRVDEKKLGQLVGEEIIKADADFVLGATGFNIGGVPPFAHQQKITTFIDQDLFSYPLIWAAAGHPCAVFSLTPKELLSVSSGQLANIV